ncbi:MAG TPA: hypothetical protein VFB62_06930, partial [Polyangiaceae bacterium]|nr:hypothetical protein [Polyangiaceae bacterium]
ELGATVFHEMRHAEQQWYLARFLAGGTTNLDPLQAAYFVQTVGNVPPWLAYLAVQYPLSVDADDWRTVLGADVYNSIFGDGRAARDLLYQEWNPLRKELFAALDKNGNDWTDPALKDLIKKDAEYFQKYTELAEENDARAAEEKFKKQCSH